jgi:hypothetical protein
MNNEAREALRVALGDREAASAALEHAHETANRARSILEEAVRESEKLDATDRRASEVIENQMRDALRIGHAPPAPASEKDVSKSAAARAALDVRRAAAERVVSDFSAAEREAAEHFQEAQSAVSAAVKGVIRAEAARLAARWAVVDEEARALRARLGAPYGLISQLGALDGEVLRGITANADEPADLAESQAVEGAWASLAAGLQSDPEARIDFGPVDQARESARADRERSHASDEEIARQLAQMRARPASPEPDWLDLMNDEAIA